MLRSRIHIPAAVAVTAVALFGVLSASPSAASGGSGPIAGFTSAHAKWQREYEKAFAAQPSADEARRLDDYLSREPGLVASSGDRRRVDYIAGQLRSYGLHPEVKTYYTYLSEPKNIQVEMTAPQRRELPVMERPRPWQQGFDQAVVGYNALSPAGKVTAPVVYANYGRPEDYAVLAENGVSVKGKIVLARYWANFRGSKTREAYLRGAKGLIIYSEPADDGSGRGPVYPDGPWRPADGIQRGSVGQITSYTGDPLTPGRPATENARRIKPAEAAELPKGPPTTPLSYGAAEPLLKNLGGKAVPKEWQGALPFTYHFGPGGTEARMNLDIRYTIKPIWDVIVRIPGAKHPGQEVVLGAHHDAWVYGSDDNLSGTENVLQIARGLGNLLKKGWRPDRSIVLATWDGEEYGLYGSTEYAEDRGETLRNAVTYINMDVAAGEFLRAATTPALDQQIMDAAKEVPWPGTGGTAYDAWKQQNAGKIPISRIGGGSDFQPFFDRYGVPAIDVGAYAAAHPGVYHCTCDDHYWMGRFGDPTWEYHAAMTRLAGITALRLADADVIPMRYQSYAAETATYLAAFTEEQRQKLGRVVVDVSRDTAQAAAWQHAAENLQARADAALRSGDTATFQRLNAKIMRAERDLLADAGLPGRSWHRHQIYAPAMTDGYATQRLPGLNDALFIGDRPDLARAYEERLYQSLRAATRTLTP